MAELTPRCNEPDPEQPDIRCNYHAGHSPIDAWPALNNPDKSRVVYGHGNSTARRWWDKQQTRVLPVSPSED